MNEPWFRKKGFTYVPIAWQGRAILFAMAAVSIPLGYIFVMSADSRPILGWTAGLLAMTAVLAGHVIVVWRMDQD